MFGVYLNSTQSLSDCNEAAVSLTNVSPERKLNAAKLSGCFFGRSSMQIGGVFLGSLSRSHPFFKFSFVLLFASRIYWNSINSILPSICNLSYSIGTNTNPNHDGSQLDRCSFHEILGYVFPPNIPSCSLQPEFILISLQDWFLECISLDWPFFFFFASLCCGILWPGCSREFL